MLKLKDTSNVWLFSDSHFGHARIIDYCGRPFKSADAMNLAMLNNWNNKIMETDIVLFLGDFVCGVGQKKVDVADIFYESLKGKKIFIAGNHDNVKDKGKIPWIEGEFKIRYKDKTFTLCHYPPTESFDTNAYIHGHTHSGKLNEFENIFNVSADAISFAPINLNVILTMLK